MASGVKRDENMEPIELCEKCRAALRAMTKKLLAGDRWTENTVIAVYIPSKASVPPGAEVIDVDDAEAEFGKMLYQIS
jgi:hypothetical protein